MKACNFKYSANNKSICMNIFKMQKPFLDFILTYTCLYRGLLIKPRDFYAANVI